MLVDKMLSHRGGVGTLNCVRFFVKPLTTTTNVVDDLLPNFFE